MINIESDIFVILSNFLRDKYEKISIYGQSIKSPAVFPCVIIEEKDNYTYTQSQTSDLMENHANLTYEINVYSNKENGKKSECRSIMTVLDEQMQSIGFTRIMLNPIDIDDSTIYRIVARYKAVISKNNILYRR